MFPDFGKILLLKGWYLVKYKINEISVSINKLFTFDAYQRVKETASK